MLTQLDEGLLALPERTGGEERHSSLSAAIRWSVQLLNPELRQAFFSLSVFRGGWFPEAAAEICGIGRDALASLRDRSLITAQAQGDKAGALKYMRAAADLEDSSEKHVAMENRLYPMRELLGDMLREQGEPAAALKEYQVSMKNAPNRLRGFYGAAKAAEAAGESKRATGYFNQLARLARTADGDRAELREMKQYLASK